jgi:hypothetical protein
MIKIAERTLLISQKIFLRNISKQLSKAGNKIPEPLFKKESE